MHTKKAITGAKRKREAERNRSRKLPVRTRVKRRIREALGEIGAVGPGASEAVMAALREIDKGATKGVLHRRAAARKKSRLMKSLRASALGAEETH